MTESDVRTVSRRDTLVGGAAVGLTALVLPAAAASASSGVGGQGGSGSETFDWVSRRSQQTFTSYNSVTHGDGRYVAVRTGGSMTSTDGATWTVHDDTDANDRTWLGISYGSWGDTPTKLFVAVGTGGDATGRVMTSTDGASWTSATSPNTATRWEDVCFGVASNEPVFVAVGANDGTGASSHHVMVSQNGTTWSGRSLSNVAFRAVCAGSVGGATLFVAVGDAGVVYTSANGISWTASTGSIADANWKSVAHGGGVFVAVGDAGAVMSSPDGVVWTTRTATSPPRNWSDVAFGGDRFVVVATSGTGSRSMWSSAGDTWTALTTPADSAWESITFGSGRFVAVSPDAGIHVMSYNVPSGGV